jgi:DNA mismatch repair protein MSH4
MDNVLSQVHRKYFDESRGLQMIKHLCAKEFNSVELQLRHKFYALSAANCLLKYIEYIKNIVYAPKVGL